MSERTTPEEQFGKQPRLTRREMTRGIGAGIVGAGLASVPVLSRETSTPAATSVASPAASPVASPDATPAATPEPPVIPETSLRIVRDQRPEYGGVPAVGGDLRMHVRASGLHDFSPTAQAQDIQILVSLYDPLVWIDEGTMEPMPWLAESWAWSSDGLALTFRLRPKIAFHDGSPLTSKDVAFSFLAYRDDYDSVMAGFFALVADVHTPDDRTVDVRFSETDGAFLFNGASQPVFSSTQYQAHWEAKPVGERTLSGFAWDEHPPLGTGPWMLASMESDRLVLERHDRYWQEPPYFDRLVLMGEDDQQRRLDEWKAGEVDLVSPVRAPELDDLWSEEGSLYVADAPIAFFTAFNFDNPANVSVDMMKDEALRKALTLAIDRSGYARKIFFGFIDEHKAGTVVQPWAYDEELRNPDQDIERAKRLLDEAGWIDADGDGIREHPSGDTLDLYCIVLTAERPELRAILGLLVEDFSKIGAKLTVQEIEPDEFDTRWVENRMYDMVAYSLVGYPAFAEYDLYGTAWDIRTNTRGWNPGGYSDAAVDEAIAAYFAAWTQEEMRDALLALQAGAEEDLFGLWFGFPSDLVLVKPDIQGFRPHMYFQTWNTRLLWRGEAVVPSASPAATPVPATPGATPVGGTPMATPAGTPRATPAS